MKNYLIIGIAVLSLVACKKKDAEAIDEKLNVREIATGKETSLVLSIKQARTMSANYYSVPDPNATTEETTIKTIDVFVYDAQAPFGLAAYERIQGQDKIYEADGKTTKKLVIKAKTGEKKVFVGINLHQEIVDKFNEGLANVSAEYLVKMDQLVNKEGNVSMFNEKVQNFTISEVEADNNISVSVSRLVAKVAVLSDRNLKLNNISGGIVSDLEFAIGQNNKKQFFMPLVDYKDPNWFNAQHSLNEFSKVDVSVYKAINAAGVGSLLQTKQYAAENTSDSHTAQQVTYVSIKAKFTPMNITGTVPINGDGTFYAVLTKVGIFYFGQEQEAVDYASKYQVDAPYKFTNGNCYYRLYLNPEGSAIGEGKYDVLRNNYYQANITRINGLGNVGPDDVNSFNLLDPSVDPITPAKNTQLEVNLTIVPWEVSALDYEI